MEDVPRVGLEIIDYSLREGGETDDYYSHEFTIRIWLGQNMYAVTRSYAAFCLFDAQLKRKFPRSTLPILPLAAASQFTKRAVIRAATQVLTEEARLSTVDLRNSLTGESPIASPDRGSVRRRGSGIRRPDHSESLTQKKQQLTAYMQSLLQIPEVLLSDTLVDFLDEQSIRGEPVDAHAGVTVIDILLAGEPTVHKTVLRHLQVHLDVEMGSVVAWTFTTKNKDIGFIVKYNDTEVHPFYRANSHIKPESGLLEISEPGKVTITFDNSYSRILSKSLTYTIRVFDRSEYESAKELAMEVARDKQGNSHRRALLKRSLRKAARDSIFRAGVLINPSCSTIEEGIESSEGGGFRTISVVESMSRLEDEKRSLQLALSASESALAAERGGGSEYEDKLSKLAAEKDLAEEKLVAAREELQALSLELQEERRRHEKSVGDMRAQLDVALRAWEESKSLAMNAVDAQTYNEMTSRVETLTAEMKASAEAQEALEQQAARLKAEKKQLKSFALQCKADVERLSAENAALQAEIVQLRGAMAPTQTQQGEQSVATASRATVAVADDVQEIQEVRNVVASTSDEIKPAKVRRGSAKADADGTSKSNGGKKGMSGSSSKQQLFVESTFGF